MVVHLTTGRIERLEPGSELHSDRGPLVVASSRFDGHRWRVRFVGVDGRGAAESLRGTTLLATPIDDPDELWVHELIGSRVVSVDGVDRGLVVEVQANPASDLLVLEGGALVPLTFVVGRPAGGIVTVDVPEGLWDL